jgi:hypothetical protein
MSERQENNDDQGLSDALLKDGWSRFEETNPADTRYREIGFFVNMELMQ